MSHTLNCYCGEPLPYDACCKPLHMGTKKAQSAEQLMRSRYSAFCAGVVSYLCETVHPHFQAENDYATIEKSIKNTKWLSLRILSTDEKQVEFVAFFEGNPVGQLHEASSFERIHDQWFYTKGKQLAPIKINRNDMCYCGNRKKYKKCCHN